MKKLNIAIIGLGQRGGALTKGEFIPMLEDKVHIVALCDSFEDRVEEYVNLVYEKAGYKPFGTTNYKEVLSIPELEAVVVASSWESHIHIAVEAMKAGKYVGLEVGGAYNVEECWELVNTSEQTGMHCMLLENACYGKRELMILNMVRQGVFGEVVHCEGGYKHDLRNEVADGLEIRHYRLRNYMHRNCENYPTHELCPIGKVLNINNGNRFITLTSIASSAKGLHRYIVDNKGEEHPLSKINFAQGDIVTTVLKCANGETVIINLDTTLPRAYSRDFTVRGTKAAYFEENDSIFIDGVHNEFDYNAKGLWGNADEYEREYIHPLWKDYDARGGHDGIDWLTANAFVDAALNNKRPPLDVYDAATYMVITALSEKSIMLGSVPVEIPDFTRGKWYMRDDIEEGEYMLDEPYKNRKLFC